MRLEIVVIHRIEGLDEILRAIAAISRKDNLIMKTLADLQADVTAETTVENSAITLMKGLSDQIAALKTAGTDPATAAAIDALAQTVESNTTTLAASVTANTPAAPAA